MILTEPPRPGDLDRRDRGLVLRREVDALDVEVDHLSVPFLEDCLVQHDAHLVGDLLAGAPELVRGEALRRDSDRVAAKQLVPGYWKILIMVALKSLPKTATDKSL